MVEFSLNISRKYGFPRKLNHYGIAAGVVERDLCVYSIDLSVYSIDLSVYSIMLLLVHVVVYVLTHLFLCGSRPSRKPSPVPPVTAQSVRKVEGRLFILCVWVARAWPSTHLCLDSWNG